MTETLKNLLNEIADYTKNSNLAVKSKEGVRFFEEWHGNVDEQAIERAFAFYKKYESVHDLH